MNATSLPEIRVTEVGEYIRHRSCDRRFRLEINGREAARDGMPFVDRLFNALDPVLQRVGRERENQWEITLQQSGMTELTSVPVGEERDEVGWGEFAQRLAATLPGQQAYGREVQVRAVLGAFSVTGNIDFVLLLWRDGRPWLRLVECKASRRDRTYHHIQVATYRMLLRQMLAAEPIVVGGVPITPDCIECVVARIDNESNANQSILDLEPLDLSLEEADVERLLAPDGRLRVVVNTPVDDLSFQIDTKCDGCVFNVHCLTESARQRRLELLGLEPSTTRAFRAVGIGNIDQLAELGAFDPKVEQLRHQPGFTENLEILRRKAQTRRHTLPGGRDHAGEHEVEFLPNTGYGQLPPHEMDGRRLLRVYLVVDYDYTENRIGALSAHVTRSPGRLHTAFLETADGRRAPDPQVYEQFEAGSDASGRRKYSQQSLPSGQELVRVQSCPWKGNDYVADTATERSLIHGFFYELVNLIAQQAQQDSVPVHFYVWSQTEMTQLIEGCCRAGSGLLRHLRELLGCREGLEQLIYSCVQDDVDRRYALGWTGRGLGVVSSLRWYGRVYHWKRLVNGRPFDLDFELTQDIFDFKTELDLDAANRWTDDKDQSVLRHRFEIRSRFNDSLPAAYWHAVWRTLPDPDEMLRRDSRQGKVANAIRRYNRVQYPNMLQEYLRARCHALRWVEENVSTKNREISKPPLTIADLPDFRLERDDVARSASDFLRLDHHVGLTAWIASHVAPPAVRVPLGRTLPLRNVRAEADRKTITASIHLHNFGLSLADLSCRCPFGKDSFVRLSPWNGDPLTGQTIAQLTSAVGRTCVVRSIEWGTGQVTLDVIPSKENRFTLASGANKQSGPVFEGNFATLDESASDFVAQRVDSKLQDPSHVYDWLDPVNPQLPALSPLRADTDLEVYRRFLASLTLPPKDRTPAPDQIEAVVEGLNTRVQLLQGPPGTGKTTTTALALLVRVLAGGQPGDIVLVSAHTHTAVNEVLRRIDRYQQRFTERSKAAGLAFPAMQLAKVHSGDPTQNPTGGNVTDIPADHGVRRTNELLKESVLVLGGTTAAVLKMASELKDKKQFNGGNGLQGCLLVVDEASMMVFPHFLALATLVRPDGKIMLTGDHRQLSPITAHDWDNEDRPPAVLYQPFASAYDAVLRIIDHPAVSPTAARYSALRLSFRLPPVVLDLIARLYRSLDRLVLEGVPRAPAALVVNGTIWDHIWQWEHGLFLLVHDEEHSKQSNEVELDIIDHLLAAAPATVRSAKGSVAVITPHRAQRSLFNSRLTCHTDANGGPVDVIDTVERLQGGERPTVIVSATVSDPVAIESNAEFILDLNRANVAFSRVQDRLVVVCSRTLLDHIPAELEHYQSAMLWKSLRELCTDLISETKVRGQRVRLLQPQLRNT